MINVGENRVYVTFEEGRYVLAELKRTRPTAGFTRVSTLALEHIERKVMTMLRRLCEAHPSNGQTFTEVL